MISAEELFERLSQAQGAVLKQLMRHEVQFVVAAVFFCASPDYGRALDDRGGARVIYFWHPESARILMLFVYSKNERDDLTLLERQALRKIVQSEYP